MNRKDYIYNCIEKGIMPDITPETNEEASLMKLAAGIVNGGGSGGGSEPYIIKYETDWVNGGETLIDGNYADAKAAFLGGRSVFFNQGNYYYMANNFNSGYISATYFETGMDGFTVYTLLLTPDNKIEKYQE